MREDNRKHPIDLNCDLGQGWGQYEYVDEELLLPYVSSVNIACGGHAGDPQRMYRALQLASKYNLEVGAHIGYVDPWNFGRKEQKIDDEELRAIVLAQLAALSGMAESMGIRVSHCRPHGAMYYRTAVDLNFTNTLIESVAQFSSWMMLVLPTSNHLQNLISAAPIQVLAEVHLDRPYRKDGVLHRIPDMRNIPYEFALAQAKSLLLNNKLIVDGSRKIRADFRTIHLSLDRPFSLDLATKVKSMLLEDDRLQPMSVYQQDIAYELVTEDSLDLSTYWAHV